MGPRILYSSDIFLISILVIESVSVYGTNSLACVHLNRANLIVFQSGKPGMSHSRDQVY